MHAMFRESDARMLEFGCVWLGVLVKVHEMLCFVNR